MRVKLQGWRRSITLEPWYEAAPDTEPETLDAAQLRRLIAEEPGTAASLRGLLHRLGDVAGLGFMSDDELAECVAMHIARGQLRVHVERYVPMSSDTIEYRPPRYEPAPIEIDEDDRHWIEVELLDEAGAPVQGERCRIILPDGSERLERTDRNGLMRVDRTIAGQCTITFPDLDARATGSLTTISRQGAQVVPSKPKSTPTHWIEVELLGEDGAAIADERCEITLPDGEVVRRKTDRSGLIRLPRIATAGDCEVRFPDLDGSAIGPLSTVARQGTQIGAVAQKPAPTFTHWIEVELCGEDGAAIAGERCEIKLPDGVVLLRKTDASGLVRVPRIAIAGDCEVRFPDIDAGALAALPSGARQGTQAGRSTASVLTPPPSMHWIEFEFLDESGAAIANAICEITLPDGEVVRRKTDASGRVHLARLADAGDCQISFVELDAAAWHAA